MKLFCRTTSLAITFLGIAGASLAQEMPRVASLPNGAVVPDAEVDGDGNVHVAYLLAGDIFYVRSEDEGLTFSKPIRVNGEAGFAFGAAFRGPDLALGRNGRVHVIWYNAGYQQKRPTEEWGVMYSHLNTNSKQFIPTRNLNQRPSDNYSLAADGNGKVTVIWMAGGVFANLSEDDGQTFSSPASLPVDPCECCGSRAIYSMDGSLSVLYRDKTDNVRDTNVARLTPGTAKWSSRKISQTPWPIDSCPMTGSFLSLAGNGLAAAWETRNQPYFAVFDERSDRENTREIRAAEKGRYPIVLAADQGPTLVAWKNENTLEWQLFDSDGTPLGKRGSHLSTSPHRPAGALAKSGRFILFP